MLPHGVTPLIFAINEIRRNSIVFIGNSVVMQIPSREAQ